MTQQKTRPPTAAPRGGSQRYKCRACARVYTPEPLPLGYGDEVKREAVPVVASLRLGFVTARRRGSPNPLPEREGQRGFTLLARRWVVERTFGWLYQSRRLSKD